VDDCIHLWDKVSAGGVATVRLWVGVSAAIAVVVLSAAAVRPGRWSAGRLAATVARQMAAGDAAGIAAEAAPALAPYLAQGHLQDAIVPLRGARVVQVRLLEVRGGTALARARYSGGRSATVTMLDAGGHRWQVAAIS
jgi:hypothetical protein